MYINEVYVRVCVTLAVLLYSTRAIGKKVECKFSTRTKYFPHLHGKAFFLKMISRVSCEISRDLQRELADQVPSGTMRRRKEKTPTQPSVGMLQFNL